MNWHSIAALCTSIRTSQIEDAGNLAESQWLEKMRTKIIAENRTQDTKKGQAITWPYENHRNRFCWLVLATRELAFYLSANGFLRSVMFGDLADISALI